MHVQIVSFEIEEISREDFQRMHEGARADVGTTPGLLQVVSLGETGNIFGYSYIWANCQAMEDYLKSRAFQSLARSPYVRNLASHEVQPAVPLGGIEEIQAPAAVAELLFERAA